MSFRTFGATCLLLWGCGQATFTELVASATDRWYAAICRRPGYREIQYVPSIPVCVPGQKNTNWLGCYEPLRGLLRVSQTTRPDDLYQVITHEIGHSISPGAHLAQGKRGVMTAYMSDSTPYITEDDIELLCEDYECPCRNPESP